MLWAPDTEYSFDVFRGLKIGKLAVGSRTEQKVLVTEVNTDYDTDCYSIGTKETGDIAKIWNHTMTLEPHRKNRSQYTDSIAVYAGEKTDKVAKMCKQYYVYRQLIGWGRPIKAISSADY